VLALRPRLQFEEPTTLPHSREQFIQAASENHSVIEFRNGNSFWASCWTEEVLRRNPPMRVEFEHAVVFGSFVEARNLREGKNAWGRLLAIEASPR